LLLSLDVNLGASLDDCSLDHSDFVQVNAIQDAHAASLDRPEGAARDSASETSSSDDTLMSVVYADGTCRDGGTPDVSRTADVASVDASRPNTLSY
jgi:hypothetical protein